MIPMRFPSSKKLWIKMIIGGVFLLLGIVSCNLPGIQPAAESPLPEAESQETTFAALVMFYVEVPTDTPANEPVLLSVLDEVTGLALNARRYPMKPAENGQYVLGLPFPVGTTVKYRFSRQGDILEI